MKQARIKVVGSVQGAFYRVWAKRQAEELGLSGFARNEPDGAVLIVAEGEEENIQKLIDRCRDGSELAKVTGVQVKWLEYTDRFHLLRFGNSIA